MDVKDISTVEDPAVFDTLARLGWYREYVRRYGSHIKQVVAAEGAAPSVLDDLLAEDNTMMEDSSSRAKSLLAKIWKDGVDM